MMEPTTPEEATAWGLEHRRHVVDQAAAAMLAGRWSPVLCDERACIRLVAARIAGVLPGEDPGARREEMWKHRNAMEAEAGALAEKYRRPPSPVAALMGWVG